MTRVLLTGPTGFIGSRVVRVLSERGHEVNACCRRPPGLELPGLRWHRLDLLDGRATADLVRTVRPAQLLHLAWHPYGEDILSSPDNDRWVEATLSLVKAFAEHGGDRAVIAGSSLEYDWGDGPCSELFTPLEPSTPYGVSKRAAERAVAELCGRTGVGFVAGRIFFVYGPGEHPRRLVASVARALLRGEPALCTEGFQRRDYLYVDDVAAAFVGLLESDRGGPFNVGSGEAIAVKDLIAAVGEATGRPELIRLGALDAKGEAPLIIADTARIRDEIGWSPAVSLEEGIPKTVEWWRNNL